MKRKRRAASTQEKGLSYYLSLPYPITLYPAEEGGYVAEVRDLPGCLTQGETATEVLELIEDAKRGWLELALETGISTAEGSLSGFQRAFTDNWPKRLPARA
jgi:antitoxin HicB